MNREQILSVLYDLSLTIGGETSLSGLLKKTLQRLLFHTSFPTGIVLAMPLDSEFGMSATVDSVIGDYRLAECLGNRFNLPEGLLGSRVELLDDVALLRSLSLDQVYTHCLRLPLDRHYTILLLSLAPPASELPLTQIFQPVLANLAKAIVLCRNNERINRAMANDRDDARAELAVALAQSERERTFLDSLYEAIPDLVWVKDPEGVYLSCNPPFSRLYNASAQDIVGRTDYDFVDRELANFFRANDRAAAAAGGPTLNEEWLTFGDNGYRGLFETIKTPMRDREGHLIGILGIAREITERLRVEEALRASEAELAQHRRHLEILVADRTHDLEQANARLAQTQFAMDRVGLGIHWVDATGCLIYVNHVAAEMLGYSVDEMLKMTVADIAPRFAGGRFFYLMADTRQAGRASYDTELCHRDGHRIPVRINVYYRAETAAEPARYITFISDISEQKRAEQALCEAKEQAESATRAKSSFLANMSHEIRTPMNAILGSVYLMRRGGGEAARSEPLNRIEASGQHLLSIIDDILDLSKIEAGKLELEEAPLTLVELMNEVAEMLSGRTREKHLSLRVEALGLPECVLGDATRLRQALLNYANNAVKFTATGSIQLSGKVIEEDERGVLVRLEVRDTGIGIEAEVLKRLFTPFQQADQSTTRNFGGTGLDERLREPCGRSQPLLQVVENASVPVLREEPGPQATHEARAPLDPQLEERVDDRRLRLLPQQRCEPVELAHRRTRQAGRHRAVRDARPHDAHRRLRVDLSTLRPELRTGGHHRGGHPGDVAGSTLAQRRSVVANPRVGVDALLRHLAAAHRLDGDRHASGRSLGGHAVDGRHELTELRTRRLVQDVGKPHQRLTGSRDPGASLLESQRLHVHG